MARPSKIEQKVTVTRQRTVDDGDGGYVTEDYETEMTIGEAIPALLRMGSYIEDAVKVVGVGESTYHAWVARGQEHVDSERVPAKEKPFVEFVEAVEKARAEAVVINLNHIATAARLGTWQAAAWWLERTRPEQFGRRQEVKHSGEIRQPSKIDRSKLTDEEAAQVERLLEKAQSDG